jgi:S1-C subfamily serine protease
MGDIILRIDNKEIESIEDLLRQIHQKKVGEKVNVAVFRRGFEQFFEVTLSSAPEDRRV